MSFGPSHVQACDAAKLVRSSAQPAPPPASCGTHCALQATVEQIESSVAKLQEKLSKEREKHSKYDAVLKEHEERWVGPGFRGW